MRVRTWTESLAVVDNLEQGVEVALVNPNARPDGRSRQPQPAAPQRAAR